MNWHDKSVLVLGAGDTGLSVVTYLRGMGARVRIADSRAAPASVAALRARDCELLCGPFTDALFRNTELVVASPGVATGGPACDPSIKRARAAGTKFIGDIELFAWHQNQLTESERPNVIAITGSNGKSTVTAMVGAMCAAAGLRTLVAGNIGVPVLDTLAQPLPDVYVLELSSFQLETTSSLQVEAAALLNLSQDHLDRYASMADYAAAKARIFAHAKTQVLNRDDAATMAMANPAQQPLSFGLTPAQSPREYGIAADKLCAGSTVLLDMHDLPVVGLHNAANALAAFALTSTLSVPHEKLAAGLRQFQGLPHRLARVGEINGITFFDDSKGTNVGATVAALSGMTMPVVWIAGGVGKEQDFSPLAQPLMRRARAVVLIGKDARLIESAITSARLPVQHATTMADAVEAAYRRAVPGDAVLLSPACASFDMFDNYHHRGEVFAAAVAALKARLAGGKHAL